MMKKEFKRKVAAFLAVLMTFNSVPLSTLGSIEGDFLQATEEQAEIKYVEVADSLAESVEPEEISAGDTSSENIIVEEKTGEEEPVSEASAENDTTGEIKEEINDEPIEEISSDITVADDNAIIDIPESVDGDVIVEVAEVVEESEATEKPKKVLTAARGGLFGDGQVAPAPAATSSEYDNIKEYADSYFIPGGELYETRGSRISFSLVSEYSGEGKPPIKAGEEVKIDIECGFLGIPSYKATTWDTGRPLFDRYYDNKVEFTLPKGLYLVSSSGTSFEELHNEDGTTNYVVHLENRVSSGGVQSVLTMYVGGNGTENAVKTYDLSTCDFTFSTSFDVMDVGAESDQTLVGTYTQKAVAHPEDFSTVSEDEWNILKNISETTPMSYDRNSHELKATFEVKIGLKDGEYGIVPDNYIFEGRNALSNVKIEELMSSLVLKAGASIYPEFKYATVTRADSQGQPTGTPYKITADKEGSETLDLNAIDCLKPDTVSVQSGYQFDPVTGKYIRNEQGELVVESTDVAQFTEYLVTAVYELPDEKLLEFYETGTLTANVENKATLVYKFANQENYTRIEKSDDGTVEIGPKNPGSFTISKELVVNGTAKPYNNEYGLISFSVNTTNVYTKEGDTYTQVTDPTKLAIGTTYYVLGGYDYTVSEALSETQLVKMTGDGPITEAVTEGNSKDFHFTNTSRRSSIKVTKVDEKDDNKTLSGAVFELYKKGDTEVFKTSSPTPTNGIIIFDNLEWGDYVLKEKTAPNGYLRNTTEFNISLRSNEEHSLIISDKRFGSLVELTKYKGTLKDGMPVAEEFGEFHLQRKVGGGGYETVITDSSSVPQTIPTSTDGNGKISAYVPAKDNNGNVYTYRFLEVLPREYYAFHTPSEYNGEAAVVSDEFTLMDGENILESKSVSMKNYRKVSITVPKNYYAFNDEGTMVQVEKDATANLTLYRKGASREIKPVAEYSAIQSSAEHPATWTDLPLYESEGVPYTYYVSESDGLSGYEFDNTDETVVDGKVLIPITGCTLTNPSVRHAINNVKQTIPIKVEKKNYYTDEWVDNAYVTVFDKDPVQGSSTAVTGGEKKKVGQNGNVYYVKPGKKYYIVETQNDTGMNQINATYADPLVIDLTGIGTQVRKNTSYTLQKATVLNSPDPIVNINKVKREKKGVSTETPITGAVFTVYKNVDGAYEPVTNANGDPVTITTGQASTVRLPAGTYYITETTVPSGYLDPNTENGFNIYKEYSTDDTGLFFRGADKDWKLHTFVKMAVSDAARPEQRSSETDNTYTFDSIWNIQNTGRMEVTKYLDDSVASGFTITATPEGGTAKTAGTNGSGIATFDLPVYDQDGNKITYTISENLTDGNTYKVSTDQSTQLSIGSVTTKVNGTGASLVVRNETYTNFEVTKYRKYTWDHKYVSILYPMSGVKVALFKQVAGADGTVNWVKEGDTKTTDVSGQAPTFTKLRRDTAYAVVELSSPEQYVYPYNDGWKKYAGEECTIIPDAELNQYNYCLIEKGRLYDSKGQKIEDQTGTLLNQDKWVQFDITKYLDNDTLSVANTQDIPHTVEYNAAGKPVDTLYDGAVFSLYRFENINKASEVLFNPDVEGSGWTLIGQYTSGTAYTLGGERLKGEFLTDIDTRATEDCIYVLVEDNSGPHGATIYEDQKYTVFRNTASVADKVTGIPDSSRTLPFEICELNEATVLNGQPEGPGEGEILLSSLRLSKWLDRFVEEEDIKTDSYELNQLGEPAQDYTPLADVKFSVYLPTAGDPVLLESLTTGLDNPFEEEDLTKLKAWAQGTLYQLIVTKSTAEPDRTTYTLKSFLGDESASTYDVTDWVRELPSTESGKQVYGIPIYIRETRAPEKISYADKDYETYLCFVSRGLTDGSTTESFSDTYFVATRETTANEPLAQYQEGRKWHVSYEETTGSGTPEVKGLGDSQLRIVDYPERDTIVRIQKYGYKPYYNSDDDTTCGKTSSELNAFSGTSINRQALEGVEMTLEKKDGNSWYYCDYKNDCTINKTNNTSYEGKSKFTTKADGSFLFLKGLKPGTYRVKETGLGSYAGTYENAYSDDSHARIFTVGDEKQVVTMYNPEKVDLTIYKQDAQGNAVENTDLYFRLKKGTSNIDRSTKNEEGKATFENLSSGTYVLSEGKANESGYSTSYLQKYINSLTDETLKANLLALTGDGYLIGYRYGTSGSDSSDRDTVINSIGFNKNTYSFVIRDPKVQKFSLSKEDENNEATKLPGAKFNLYYHAFDSWPADGETLQLNATRYPSSSFWTKKSYKNTAGKTVYEWVTGTDGSIEFEYDQKNDIGLAPGIYAVVETEAPAGYDILKDTSSKQVIYYVILTGGLQVNVTGLPSDVEVCKVGETTPYSVTTLFKDPASDALILAKNRPMKKATAVKTVDKGQFDTTTDWTVTLNLYKAKSTAADNLVGTATIAKSDEGKQILFKNGSADAYFTQGATYWLTESVTVSDGRSPADYQIATVSVAGTPVTKDGDFYPVQFNDSDINIEVVNIFKRGKVTFKKTDFANFANTLPGATFAVFDGTTQLSDVHVSDNNGVYTVDFPLQSLDEKEYTIKEVTAPTGYILEDGKEIRASLSAEKNVLDYSSCNETEKDKYISNRLGYDITLTKYNNWRIRSTDGDVDTDQDVQFTLFERKGSGEWKVTAEGITIDTSGQVTWLLDPEKEYAIAETGINLNEHNKFFDYPAGHLFESVWRIYPDDREDTQVKDFVQITMLNGTTYDCLLLQDFHEDLAFNVYNNSKQSLVIKKQDVGGYPEGIVAGARFEIIELEEPLPTDPAEAENVINSIPEGSILKDTVPVEGENYSAYTWTERDLNKYYVVVERQAQSCTTGETYDTLNRDDNRVVWYQAVNTNSDYPEGILLKNVYSDVTAGISKKVKKADEPDTAYADEVTIPSMLLSGADLVYQITPTVESHNQPLTSYQINESGLSFIGGVNNAETPIATYTITGVSIGNATHVVSNLKELEEVDSAPVSAIVTWYNKEGSKISDTPVADLATGAVISSIPEGAQSFSIQYYSAAVRTAYPEIYDLGQDFNPGAITVSVSVDRIENGTPENKAIEVTSFNNTADVKLDYKKWNAKGTERINCEPIKVSDNANVKVGPVAYPVIRVQKSAPTSTQINKELVYTITAENTSQTETFIDPIILDMLPTDVIFNGTYELTPGSGVTITKVDVERVNQNPAEAAENGLDPDTAVLFKITGTMAPNSSLVIKLHTIVGGESVVYEENIVNSVYMGSSYHSWYTTTNPYGYSFRTTEGTEPENLQKGADRVHQERLGKSRVPAHYTALKEALGDYKENQYGWVIGHAATQVEHDSSMTLVKSIMGDQDTSYSSLETSLAVSTRTKTGVSSGWVKFRLDVQNSAATAKENLVIADAIPKKANKISRDIESEWDVVMDPNPTDMRLTVDGVEKPYKIYYYYGPIINGIDTALTAALNEAKAAGTFSVTGKTDKWFESGMMPEGHTMEEVSGFLVVLDPSVQLPAGKVLSFEYNTFTETIDDDVAFADVEYTNAVNNFYAISKGVTNRTESNNVTVTVIGGSVDVAGDVWIDEDWDDTQEDTGNRRNYEEYAIIRKLSDSIKVTIRDERQYTQVERKDNGGVHTEGESIKHFSFTDLGPAYIKNPAILYNGDLVNRAALKTTDPYIYSLVANVDPSLMASGIFRLTGRKAGYYISDDPANIPDEHRYDSNFLANTDVTYEMKPFILRSSATTDETKDIGFRMYRDLKITKVAADDSTTLVPEAKFNLYGPFVDHDLAVNKDKPYTVNESSLLKFRLEDGVYVLDPEGTVTDLITGSNGNIKVEGLNWWKEYILQEVENGTGYMLEGATIEASDANTRVETTATAGQFILKVPGKGKDTILEDVTVKDVRKTEVVLDAFKVLDVLNSDYKLQENNFSFELRDAEGHLVEYKPNDASGKVTFKQLTFNTESTYTYTIKEVIPSPKKPHITYSEAEVTATVEVKWVPADMEVDVPHFKATVTYTGGEDYVDDETTYTGNVFRNTYKALTSSVYIPISKTVTGNERTDADWKDTFEFVLKPEGEAPVPTKGTVVKIADTGEKDFTEKAKFEELLFCTGSIAGTHYKYDLYEKKTDKYSYTYDEKHHTVEVVVKDVNGALKTTVTIDGNEVKNENDVYDLDNEAKFTNKYTPDFVTASIAVKKQVTGNERVHKKIFQFILTDAGGHEQQKTITDSGEVSFDVFKFTEAGTYKYKVKEVDSKAKSYTYDEKVYDVKFVVTDDDGILYAETFVDGVSKGKGKSGSVPVAEALFANDYHPDKATLSIPIKKIVSGNLRPTDLTFTFELTGDNIATKSVAIKDDGTKGYYEKSAEFEELVFDHIGEYRYQLREVPGENHGYVFDSKIHNILVTVTDEDGWLATTVKDTTGDPAETTNIKTDTSKLKTDEVVFTNTYCPDPATRSIAVSKAFKEGSNPRPDDYKQEFKFVLKASSSDAPMPDDPADWEVTVVDTGAPEFGEIKFTAAGTYEYTVTETKEDHKGYTYDEHVYEVKYVVTDKLGKLYVDTYVDGDPLGDGAKAVAKFNNEYHPSTATASFAVKKTFTDDSDERVNKKEFSFTFVQDDSDEVKVLPEKTTVTVEDAGEASFGEMVFTKAGVYHYTVSEVNEGLNGYKYDAHEYKLVFTVVDNKGTLEYSYTVDDQGDDTAYTENAFTFDFLNEYHVKPNEVALDVTKKFTGAERPEAWKTDFTFVLEAKTSGAPMPAKDKVVITDAGTKGFETITYTKVGTYEYDLYEVDDKKEGYTYDGSRKKVVVTVTDEEGVLKAACKIDGVDTTSAEFTNEFVGASDLTITKTVTGVRISADFGFTVKLLKKDGTPFAGTLAAVKMHADGTTENVTLAFDAEGVAAFTLKDKEKLEIKDLLIGTKYFVTETDAHGYKQTAEGDNGILTADPALAAFKNHKSGGGGGGGGDTPTTPAPTTTVPTTPAPTSTEIPTTNSQGYIPGLPAGPTGGGSNVVYRDEVRFTPQEVFSNNVLGASDTFRNNLVLAAQNFRNNLVLGAGASRVFTGDTANIGLYIFLLFASGLVAAGALILGKRKKEDED